MGNLFENFVVAEEMKRRFNRGEEADAYFYRNSSGTIEVDLNRWRAMMSLSNPSRRQARRMGRLTLPSASVARRLAKGRGLRRCWESKVRWN
jgi:hypothetical protein